MSMVNDGVARLLEIEGYQCIRLNYSKIAQLRDASLKINERFLIRYLDGGRRERAAVEGWRESSFPMGGLMSTEETPEFVL